MTRVIVSADAKREQIQILRYLEKEAGARTAAKYAAKFRDMAARLKEFPEFGALRPALGIATRVAVIAPYIMVYDYAKARDLVMVLRVLHGRRDVRPRS
ncbi:MAG: type II toxin-antitoxin system RelE/ParE family toxin [Chitinophagales bacterium]|nr:type II toxin-antitoxin system RelE/ParE family toxin [Hyphomicrobiales bacterium]